MLISQCHFDGPPHGPRGHCPPCPPSRRPCVNCNIKAGIKLQCAYNDALRTLFAQRTQPKYRALSTHNIVVDIEVEYYCDNTIYQKGQGQYYNVFHQKFPTTFLLILTQI